MAASRDLPETGISDAPTPHVVRPAAVAGMFYPGSRTELNQLLGDLLAEAGEPDELATSPGAPWPVAIVVPHAGYIYSGPIAALAYALIGQQAQHYRAVVVLGPTHRVGIRGMALTGADALETPLGRVDVDPALTAAAEQVPMVFTRPDVHAAEHSIEVQLPFLQRVLPGRPVLPVAVGDASPDEVAALLTAVWRPGVLIVISSDLSHYHRYADAQRIDADTVGQILQLRLPLHPQQACGAFPLNGMMLFALHQGWRPELLGACNSGDTAGDRERVVGYASLAFYHDAEAEPDAH